MFCAGNKKEHAPKSVSKKMRNRVCLRAVMAVPPNTYINNAFL